MCVSRWGDGVALSRSSPLTQHLRLLQTLECLAYQSLKVVGKSNPSILIRFFY